jgi:tagatose-6-phosphate ketose/aldose isomerase
MAACTPSGFRGGTEARLNVTEHVDTFGFSVAQLRSGGAEWTAREIAQQPQLWPEILRVTAADTGLQAFLAPWLANPALRIVLTGAGTSSFIGECLAPALVRAGRQAQAIASTDIVASPGSTLRPNSPTLMVHFARSGNSPESLAALDLAAERIPQCGHLIVTCNAEGDLYRRGRAMSRTHVLLLPAACNDQGFAMTSSFTGMLLAAGLALKVMADESARIAHLGALAAHLMTGELPLITALVRARFERAVFLGSNELKGLAREAALKMLELTDGRVVSLGESPLGFRHGPKTIVNGSTLVLLFLSNDPHTRRYELDLLSELRRDAVAGRVIALGACADSPGHPDTRLLASTAGGLDSPPTDLELILPYVVFAQSLAVLRSLSLGLTPDNPNAAGTVSRVVQGVSIYPAPPAA